MTAMPDWGSGTMAERMDRLEALEQIRLLASRYALCLDTRNLDEMVKLFVEDVQVGRSEFGREAMKGWFTNSFKRFRASIHQVMNHIIDLEDADHARGVVYCRDELDKDGKWLTGVIQYWDTYERRGGRWYFKRRRLFRWYMVDALKRPAHGVNDAAEGSPLHQGQLPDAWPTWERFWNGDPYKV